jgi:DNA repair protein RecO (recombination protein O)
MDWQDEGIIIGLLRHGESAVVLEVFTRAHGRHKGYVHGGMSRSKRGILQPGNLVSLAWRGRLPESLGTFTVEQKTAHAAGIMVRAGPLAALRALSAMLSRALPEHDPHPNLFDGLGQVMAVLATEGEDDPAWGAALARFEALCLAYIGFGLDLGQCAVTGAREGLAFVSPRTGRAVTEAGAGMHREKLLPLPAFLASQASADWPQVARGLRLTGHFLERFFMETDHRPLPDERYRLQALIDEKAARYSGA